LNIPEKQRSFGKRGASDRKVLWLSPKEQVASILDRKGPVETADDHESWSQEHAACELRLPLCPDVRQLSMKGSWRGALLQGSALWSAVAACGPTHTTRRPGNQTRHRQTSATAAQRRVSYSAAVTSNTLLLHFNVLNMGQSSLFGGNE